MTSMQTDPIADGIPTGEVATPAPFAERAMQIFNDACLALLIGIGHQTRLFDVLATLPPATTKEIAEAADLQERYVREWLGGMVVGGIVQYDAAKMMYFLPPDRAALLTRAAGADNFAAFMQYVALMGENEQDVVRAFRDGGGVPYSKMPRFQQLQGEESRQMYSASLVQSIVPLDRELERRLQEGVSLLDIGTGSGIAVNLLAQAFPASRFRAYDMSEEGIGYARAEARSRGLTNVEFEVKDIVTIDETNVYDVVTAFDVIHDLAKPREVLRNAARALRDDGIFMMVDIAASSRLEENIANPLAPALFTFSTMHCMTVSLAQDGEALGTVWGEQKAIELLKEAGFESIDVQKIEGDILHAFYFARK